MNGFVVDASLTACWLLPDESNAYAFSIYEGRTANPLFAPALWSYEIRNMLLINERRRRITEEASDAAIRFLNTLGLTLDHQTNWEAVVDIARRFNLTVYDASYLELSVRLDLPIATLDKALAKAAAQLDRLANGQSLTP